MFLQKQNANSQLGRDIKTQKERKLRFNDFTFAFNNEVIKTVPDLRPKKDFKL